jgi:myo-inositol-1(or 4)-monophosphatase
LLASDGIDRTAIAARLTEIVSDAGRLALQFFKSPVKSWFKGAGEGSPVSEADIAVDLLMKERLSAAAIGCGWLSEETEDDSARLSSERVWVVDPIDGTRAFLAGRPDWLISAALVERGRPTVAALYAPVTDEQFAAVRGQGATLNGVAIAVDKGAALAGARVAGPRSMLERLSAQAPGIIVEPRVYSLALRFARVAEGRIDIALGGGNSHDWDLAGADLLVHEAGGVLTTMTGETITYNLPQPRHEALLAASPPRHRIVSDIIAGRPIAPR